jgi:hypothetical protein
MPDQQLECGLGRTRTLKSIQIWRSSKFAGAVSSSRYRTVTVSLNTQPDSPDSLVGTNFEFALSFCGALHADHMLERKTSNPLS